MSAAGPLVVEVPRTLAGLVAGVVLLGLVVVAVAWATRERTDDVVTAAAQVDRERVVRGPFLPRTRVMHPERGLGTIADDPPLPGRLFPVYFDRDHPRRVRWEPSTLLSPVTDRDELLLVEVERRGAAVFPSPRPAPADPRPCSAIRPCRWHNPDDCLAAPCCDACPTARS